MASSSTTAAAPMAGPGHAYFRDATRPSGMTFVHRQGSNLIYMSDTSSPGVAVFDYDGDGWHDIFMLQGCGHEHTHDASRMPPSHLYRGGPEAILSEVGAAARIASRGWGQSCLAWDFDNDGYEDLMLTHYQEPQKLFRNNGDGTFREVAKATGLAAGDLVWASALAALDFDSDGWLDVYVGQYLKLETKDMVRDPPLVADALAGPGASKIAKTLIPELYDPLEKRLFWNLRGAGFADVTGAMGVADPKTRTYGIVSCDLDGDGWIDLFLANDASVCSLFRNEAGKRFSSRGAEAWVGENRGSMGVAVGDVNLDGAPDIVVTHWLNPPAVYRNFVTRKGQTKLRFMDRANQLGLLSARDEVGWGVGFLDVDNDSLEDLLQVNGHGKPDPARPGKLVQRPADLWRMTPAGHFERVLAGPSDPVLRPRVGRSAAFGDLNRDGFCDVVLGNNNEPGEIWLASGGRNAWVGITLVGTRSNRDGIGAHLTLVQGARVRVKQLTSGESYYASNAHQLLFGLGPDESALTCRIRWPSGTIEEFSGQSVRRYHRAVEGQGRIASSRSAGASPGASR